MRVALIAPAVGAADIGDGGVGVTMLGLQRGNQRVFGVDRQRLGAGLVPEPHSVCGGHGVFLPKVRVGASVRLLAVNVEEKPLR
jgi:hypothetical protein